MVSLLYTERSRYGKSNGIMLIVSKSTEEFSRSLEEPPITSDGDNNPARGKVLKKCNSYGLTSLLDVNTKTYKGIEQEKRQSLFYIMLSCTHLPDCAD